ncbi:hypothetical protein HDV63DRAFT_49064 [Trichoderma sp. SZMC 28014]
MLQSSGDSRSPAYIRHALFGCCTLPQSRQILSPVLARVVSSALLGSPTPGTRYSLPNMALRAALRILVTQHADIQQVMKLCRSRSMRGRFQRYTSCAMSSSPLTQ